jgi:class 3 adenylate cyclase
MEADEQGSLSGRDLDVLAVASFWLGHGEEAIATRERAFSAYTAEGNTLGAGAMALELVRDNSKLLNNAIAAGWLARATRLLSGLPESKEHGYLARWKAHEALEAGNLEEAEALSTEALEIGMRLGDPNIQALGLMQRGASLIHAGRVKEGLADVDEAMIAVAGDELDTLTTAVVYCNAIAASRDLTDYQRAGQWTDAAKRWCSRQSLSGFSGTCRVFRSEIIRLRGAYQEAEEEALNAVKVVEDWDLQVAAAGSYELGEIKLRLGEWDKAEEYFRRANEWGKDPQPGLALLWLSQGKTEAASASIRRALVEAPHDRLTRARLLPAQVEIAIAAGDIETASRAADELDTIAVDFGTALLRATARCARGFVCLASGEGEVALGHLREAQKTWQQVDAPYETAKCRLVLAEAYEAAGYTEDATLERAAARAVFSRLGVPEDTAPVVRIHKADQTQTREGRAFMFTDIVESTPLLEAIGDEAWSDLLAWHDQKIRSIVLAYDGEVVKHSGDGFFLAFPTINLGVECAIEIQRGLAEHRRSAGFAPQVRVGLHFSEATSRDGDYFGKGVNEAARIGGLAKGGEILASEASVRDLGLPSSEARELQLKGIKDPIQVVALDWREL